MHGKLKILPSTPCANLAIFDDCGKERSGEMAIEFEHGPLYSQPKEIEPQPQSKVVGKDSIAWTFQST